MPIQTNIYAVTNVDSGQRGRSVGAIPSVCKKRYAMGLMRLVHLLRRTLTELHVKMQTEVIQSAKMANVKMCVDGLKCTSAIVTKRMPWISCALDVVLEDIQKSKLTKISHKNITQKYNTKI